jgi:hypothetical protein
MPEEFFTVESMLTLTGATLITMVMTNTVQYAFNFNPKWFGLLIAFLVSITGVIIVGNHSFVAYLVGVLNGFLIYANSAGIMQMAGTKKPEPSADNMSGYVTIKRKFHNKWY